MANLLLGWQNAIMAGTLSASDQEPALPVSNLQLDGGSAAEAWQCPATAGWFQFTLPAAAPFRVFSLHRTNLTTGATLRVRVWNNADGSGATSYDTGVVTAGVVSGFGQAVLVASAAVLGRTVRIDITDPGNPDGFLSVAQAFVGPAWQPRRNYGYGSSILRTDSSVETTTRGGGESVRNDWQRRGFDLLLNAIAPDEVATVEQIDATARRGGNLFFVPNPDGAELGRTVLFGRVKPAGGIGYANNSRLTRTWRATITERL